MADIKVFEEKRSGETLYYAVDFINQLDGDSIQTAPVWEVAVVEGTDASPSSILSGVGVIQGTQTKQRITGGVDGVTYSLIAKVTTANGQELHQACRLTINDDK